MKKKSKSRGYAFQLSKEEASIMDVLREKHCINIAALFKRCLRKELQKIEQNENNHSHGQKEVE